MKDVLLDKGMIARDIHLGENMTRRDILPGKDMIDAPPSKERCIIIMNTETEKNEIEITQREEKVCLHKEEGTTNISLVTEIVIPQTNQ